MTSYLVVQMTAFDLTRVRAHQKSQHLSIPDARLTLESLRKLTFSL